MADSYFNLSVDVRDGMNASNLCESEESWYLKKCNQRNNSMILCQVAKEIGLKIPLTSDAYSYNPREIAMCTSETLIYDLNKSKYTDKVFY